MTSTTSTFIPSEAVVAPSTDAPLGLLPVLVIDELVQHITPPTIDELFPDNLKPSTGVIAAGETLQTIGLPGPGAALQAAGQTMRAFGFDEAEADGLTGTGPMMPAFDKDEDPSLSEQFKANGSLAGAAGAIMGVTPAAPAAPIVAAYGGVLYGVGIILGAFGLDVDESEPTIPEVGVDALA
jgi:hypothetical protein